MSRLRQRPCRQWYMGGLVILSVMMGMFHVRERLWSVPLPKTEELQTIDSLAFPISNILLLGQFNYHTPAVRVQVWMKIWSKYFDKIAVAGPFSKNSYNKLKAAGVEVYHGREDHGYSSPVENLVAALLHWNQSVDAILYTHDDALLNLTELAQGRSYIPTDKFIGTMESNSAYAYSITIPRGARRIRFSRPDDANTTTKSQGVLLSSMPSWYWQENCLNERLSMLKSSPDLYRFATPCELGHRFFFPSYAQSDMLLVPTKFASTFLRAALPHVQHRVFLECAFPTIVLWTLQEEERRQQQEQQQQHQDDASNENKEDNSKDQQPVPSTITTMDDYLLYTQMFQENLTSLDLCTSWEADQTRGLPAMLENCLLQTNEPRYGFVHPIKMTQYRHEKFSTMLDQIQYWKEQE